MEPIACTIGESHARRSRREAQHEAGVEGKSAPGCDETGEDEVEENRHDRDDARRVAATRAPAWESAGEAGARDR